jgi:hypothetical protein
MVDNVDSFSVNNGTKPFLYLDTVLPPNLFAIPANLIELSASSICLQRDERLTLDIILIYLRL